jgi:hypothetical protein
VNAFLHHSARLESVLRHGRDRSGKADASKLSRTQKAEAATILCEAFAEILDKELIRSLFEQIRRHFQENQNNFTSAEVETALQFFQGFLDFEANLFESKQVPRVVADETFASINDLKEGLRNFMTDASFRNELLDPKKFVDRLEVVKQTVCAAENVENAELLMEKRFILGGLASSALNTAADIITGATVLFTVMSTGAGVLVAWRRLNW